MSCVTASAVHPAPCCTPSPTTPMQHYTMSCVTALHPAPCRTPSRTTPLQTPLPPLPVDDPPAPAPPTLVKQPSLKRGDVSSRNMTNRAKPSSRALSSESAVSAGGVPVRLVSGDSESGCAAGAGAGGTAPSGSGSPPHLLAEATADAVKSMMDSMMAAVHANVESALAGTGVGDGVGADTCGA
jgi:hypothetical protein